MSKNQFLNFKLNVKQFFKIISFSYLIVLSLALLIPLDLFIITQFVEAEKQPSNNTSFIIHLVLFFILYLLFYFSFSNKYKILLFCIIYSVVVEMLQIFTSRGFQIFDIIFNLIGVLVSFIFLLYFYKNKRKQKGIN
jgi:VanZ family protein